MCGVEGVQVGRADGVPAVEGKWVTKKRGTRGPGVLDGAEGTGEEWEEASQRHGRWMQGKRGIVV